MEFRSRSLLQSVLLGYLVLLVLSILTGNPIVSRATDFGFAIVSALFGYVIYTSRSPGDDERVVRLTAGAFAIAAVAQVIGLLPGFGTAALAATAFFVVGFVGYFYLRRSSRRRPI
ncbi:hypothetical protein [Halobellus rufus]|uniref:hypothetical protein n=1 Tax=Halobellus rufus TaxID=1448860 RepID=UPI000679175F|nr:hypothetical protein [Halobellus rufus]